LLGSWGTCGVISILGEVAGLPEATGEAGSIGKAGSGDVGSVTAAREGDPDYEAPESGLQESKRSRFLRSDSSTFPDRVGVCSIRRECLPNCLCTGYQCILATRSRFTGNGYRHRRGGGVRFRLLLVLADLFVGLPAHGPHGFHYSGPRRVAGVIRILSNANGRYCRSPAYRRRGTPAGTAGDGGPPAPSLRRGRYR
jgi:hypothetical protein